MLPGFRFLFAAIVLSISVLMFGMGAAALLRASHREFASNPARHTPPEPMFTQQNEPPTLALLRLEPTVPEPGSEGVSTEPAAEPTVPAEPEQLAALTPDMGPADVEMPETPVWEPAATEPTPAPEVDPAPAEAVLGKNETDVAALVDSPPASETPAASAPMARAPQISTVSVWIAALTSPAVAIESLASTTMMDVKPDGEAIKKRAKAKRSKERRRTVQRTPPTPLTGAPQLNPFGQPFMQTTR